jgi:hypothetical protein
VFSSVHPRVGEGSEGHCISQEPIALSKFAGDMGDDGGDVATRNAILWSCLILIAVLLAGCSGTNNLTLQNPPAPSEASVSIAFDPTPTASISLVQAATFTAVVSDDPSNAGVDWVLLCQSGMNCGTISPLHTASSHPVSYKPPPSITGNNQVVSIEAFASANHSSNISTKLAVTGFASNLKGTYVFATQGADGNTGGPYQIAGVVVLDGNGNVTGGEQTFADTLLSVSDTITGGSYYIGPDGRGTLTINTADQNIGQAGIENLGFVFLSSSQAIIETLDNPNLSQFSNEMSTGTLQSQTSKAAPTGGYAFVVNGEDIGTDPLAIGGVLNIDSPNAISGKGSIVDEDDASIGLNPSVKPTGTLTTPDAFGSLKFNLTTSFASSLQFTGYIVDSTHIKLVESDINGTGGGFGATSGVAVGQGAATGTFTSTSAFSGTYVFAIYGDDPTLIPLSLASDGQFTADGAGNLNTGYDDEVLSSAAVVISDSFTGTYTVDPSGTGRVDTGSSINFSNPSNGAGPELIFYLTGNGNAPLVLDADDNINSLADGSIGAGQTYLQSSPPFSFNGKFGVSFIQTGGITDNSATGQITANENAGTLSGVVDTTAGVQFSFAPSPDTPLTGTFSAIPNTGRFTGTLTNAFFPASVDGVIAVAFYPVNPNLILFIETDYNDSNVLTSGYFATRTTVCPTCQ